MFPNYFRTGRKKVRLKATQKGSFIWQTLGKLFWKVPNIHRSSLNKAISGQDIEGLEAL